MNIKEVKSNSAYGVTREGKVFSRKSGMWKELKPQKDTDGYLQVRLYGNNLKRLVFVHRLVADAFLSKSENNNEVNHIDGNKLNNDANNLEWTTRSRNMLHAHDRDLIKTRTPIAATNVKTGERTLFSGQHEAARQLHLTQGNINHALKRGHGTCRGYSFEYVRGDD